MCLLRSDCIRRSLSVPQVIGYGAQSEAPTPEDLPSSAVLRPGDEMLGDVRRVTCA